MADRRQFLARTLAHGFTLAAAAAGGACASPTAAAAGQLVQVQIVDRASGSALPEHRHRGTAWVAGRPGDRYAVRLSNRSGGRVLVVLSVDGVNAVTGETAATSQSGYVLAPWQTAEITGWRKSDAEAAAFYFTALPDSYAARTDRPHNVGVIGVAVFRERVPPPRPVPFEVSPPTSSRHDDSERRARAEAGTGAAGDTRAAESAAGSSTADAAAGTGGSATGSAAGRIAQGEGAREATPDSVRAAREAPAAPALQRAERLGTGHGEREVAPIRRTTFERASSTPAEVVQVRYDSHANLVAAGVIRPHWPRPGYVPDPFPGYVPDPR
ncbi:MAG: hypothetical protein KIT17_20230 [Rubrivivax sp.]|nr:hypothetical protein [Rubrivivax sp.]